MMLYQFIDPKKINVVVRTVKERISGGYTAAENRKAGGHDSGVKNEVIYHL